MRFELMTSSLPRRRSTPELRGLDVEQVVNLFGRSNLKTQINNLRYILERATRLELATLSLEG